MQLITRRRPLAALSGFYLTEHLINLQLNNVF
jgi:hypothetical protein